MFKELIYNWLWKGLEILLVAFLGYWLFVLLMAFFHQLVAVIGVPVIFYFFGNIIKPYIDQARKWLYVKITGIDEEDF